MNLRARASEAWGRVMALFSTRQHDRDLAEDLETHLELLTDEYVRRGMDRQAARRAARLQFGTMSSAMEAHRDARSARWIEAAVKDARYAVRMLRKQPGLACAVILTLGLGIGVPTSVVSLLDRFAFRTPVSRDPGTFFRLALERSGGRGVATLPLYLALRDEAQPIEDLAAWSTFRLTAPLGLDDPTRVDGLLVSCNLFQVFGVAAPVAGRLLTADDCASGAAVAVMSEGTWTRRFGRDPAIIGTSMIYGGLPITVVGVSAGPALQRQATDPDADEISDLWFPYSAKDSLKSVGAFHESPNWPWLELAGHRKVGVSLAAAEAEITALERQRNPKPSRETALRLTDGSRWAASTDDILGLYALALILPVVVLIMASVSVAALLLSRGAARRREVAVRLALGASRGALVRMLFVESLVVSGAAALLALVIVYNVPPFLVRFFDGELMFGSIDRLSPDWRVFMTLAVCGVMAGLLAGLAPALESLSPRLAESLFGRPRGGSRRGMSRTRRVLVAVQIASGMVLLVTAATFSRTGARVTTPGFETRGVLVAEIPDQQKRVSLSTLADDVAALDDLRRPGRGRLHGRPAGREPRERDADPVVEPPAGTETANDSHLAWLLRGVRVSRAGRPWLREGGRRSGGEPASHPDVSPVRAARVRRRKRARPDLRYRLALERFDSRGRHCRRSIDRMGDGVIGPHRRLDGLSADGADVEVGLSGHARAG